MSRIILIKKPIQKTNQKVNIKYDSTIKEGEEKKYNNELAIRVRRNVFISIILRKNGSALLVYVPNNCKSFSVEGNTYFNVKSGCYIIPKTMILSVYLEGVVLPIEHKYLKYQKHNVLLLNREGRPVKDIDETVLRNDVIDLPKDEKGHYLKTKDGYIIKRILDRIKGLEFDSVIANAIYHSGLIEKVSKGGKPEKYLFWIYLFLIINICISISAIAVRFF